MHMQAAIWRPRIAVAVCRGVEIDWMGRSGHNVVSAERCSAQSIVASTGAARSIRNRSKIR